jgi:hypothetical protein
VFELATVPSALARSGPLATANLVSLVFLLGAVFGGRILNVFVFTSLALLTSTVTPPRETGPLRSLRGSLTLTLAFGSSSGGFRIVEKLSPNFVPALPLNLSVNESPEVLVVTLGIVRRKAVVLLNVKANGGVTMDLVVKPA